MCMGETTPHVHSRRSFLRRAAVGSSLVCTFGHGWQSLLGMARPLQTEFDLVVKGGKVVDPSQRLSAPRDIGIRNGKVAAIEETIAETRAGQVLDARGKVVTPGYQVRIVDAQEPAQQAGRRVLHHDESAVVRKADQALLQREHLVGRHGELTEPRRLDP